jgi:phosphatidylinositol alpha-1,6-mannosyltransferase
VVVSIHSLKPKASRLAHYTLARADRVLFNSNYTLSQAKDKGYFPCKAQVVHQGYDDKLFPQPRLNESRAALGIPHDATLILTLGRMIEVKGFHVLARVADRILAARLDAHLVFAGDGPQRPELESIVATQSSRPRIHFTGALPRHQVAKLFADADLFVNPGIVDSTGRAEGFGITTIEAMASGLACVGGNVGGIPETIVPNETGLLVIGGDEAQLVAAISRLIDDASMRKRMGQAAQQRAKDHFTWPVLADKVHQVYEQLLAQ